MKNSNISLNNLNDNQKVNYVKNLLFNSEINDAMDILLKNEKKDLKVIKLILKVLDENLIIERIKEQCNLNSNDGAKLFVYSKILGVLSFYNKSIVISSLLKSLSEDERKKIAFYEYQNKTLVSLDNKIFNKFCIKYKQEALNGLVPTKEEQSMFVFEIKKFNEVLKQNKKKVILSTVLVTILVFTFLLGLKYHLNYKLIKKYDGLIYPGIYINDTNLSGKKIEDLSDIIDKEKDKIKNGTIIISNINGKYKFTYEELGVKIDDKKLEKEIIKYNDNLSSFKKVRMIKSKKRNKTFYLNGEIYHENVEKFMSDLEKLLNTNPKEDGLVIDDDKNVHYDKGLNGFTLDVEKTKIKVEDKLSNLKEKTVIEAEGSVIKNEVKHENLSSINKKISSYTTYFANVGNRGHNIVLASSRLNNTTLMPGEEFSYLKVVGPYNGENGYRPAPIYLNGVASTANGGGVCQLASTLYNAELIAGLQTITRRGHTFAPTYVPKGLDATVYSTSQDFKFKNVHDYPVFIVSYVKGDYLTVDIWSNENALNGYTYEPYSVASNGGWLAYLKVIKDGNLVETKYLDRSVYKAH